MTEIKVSTIAGLKKAAQQAELVSLNGWDGETPFNCRLRRSSLRMAITAGKIPNALMGAAQTLYEGQNSRAKSTLQERIAVMEIIVDDALVEPKLAELRDAGIELTEEQFGAIFSYAQKGLKAVQPFLYQPANLMGGSDGQAVEDAAE